MASSDTARFYQSHDGLRLFYRDFSPAKAGTPVICLPGLTRNSRDFEDLARHLSERRRVLTPDLRGRGLSQHDPDWRNYHPGTYVKDVLRLLDLLGIERTVVIGTSLGGLIAMAIALLNPKRLHGAVLNDVGPEIAPEGLARIEKYTGRLPPVANWDEAIAQTREIYGATLPGLTNDDWRRMARRAYREGDNGTPRLDIDPNIGEAVRTVGPQTVDPWQAFDALRETSLLVLRGAMSDILSEATLSRMQERNPNLIAVTVPNRGHVPLLNEPAAISAIDTFLRSL